LRYNDTNLTIRVPRKLKEDAILLRIPLGPVCRHAIKQQILNGNGGLPVENIRSTKQAVIVFNKIRPVLDALITESFLYDLEQSADPLALLKAKIVVIPDHFLRNYVDFITGGHFSEQVLRLYLEEFESCTKNAKNAEKVITSLIA